MYFFKWSSSLRFIKNISFRWIFFFRHRRRLFAVPFFFSSSAKMLFFLLLLFTAFYLSQQRFFFFAALLVFLLYLSLSICLSRWLHWIDSKMLSDEIALCEKVRREYMNVNGDSESKTMIRLGLNALGNWFTTTFCLFFFSLVVVVVFGIFFAKKCEYFVVVAVWQVKILEWEYQ